MVIFSYDYTTINSSYKTMNKKRYDWRGNVAQYSERHGWHLRPTEERRRKRREEHMEKRKGKVDNRTGKTGKSK